MGQAACCEGKLARFPEFKTTAFEAYMAPDDFVRVQRGANVIRLQTGLHQQRGAVAEREDDAFEDLDGEVGDETAPQQEVAMGQAACCEGKLARFPEFKTTAFEAYMAPDDFVRVQSGANVIRLHTGDGEREAESGMQQSPVWRENTAALMFGTCTRAEAPGAPRALLP